MAQTLSTGAERGPWSVWLQGMEPRARFLLTLWGSRGLRPHPQVTHFSGDLVVLGMGSLWS